MFVLWVVASATLLVDERFVLTILLVLGNIVTRKAFGHYFRFYLRLFFGRGRWGRGVCDEVMSQHSCALYCWDTNDTGDLYDAGFFSLF